jgi:hypothetical protein
MLNLFEIYYSSAKSEKCWMLIMDDTAHMHIIWMDESKK